VEQVKSFTYLGSIITVCGGVLEDVCSRSMEVRGPSCSSTQFGGIQIF